MIETINDVLSILTLLSVPVGVGIVCLFKQYRKRKMKLLERHEPYYREW